MGDVVDFTLNKAVKISSTQSSRDPVSALSRWTQLWFLRGTSRKVCWHGVVALVEFGKAGDSTIRSGEIKLIAAFLYVVHCQRNGFKFRAPG